MKENISISEIMSTTLITLHPKEFLSQAKNIFDQFKFHHIPIEVMGKIVGILSLGDLLFLEKFVSTRKDPMINQVTDRKITVDEIMTINPVCVESNTKLSDALCILTEKRINALPVVDEGKLVGLLTTYDILKFLKTSLSDSHN